MRPANEPGVDYKDLVRRGYNACAASYAEARCSDAGPELDLLTSRLTDGARVLDIGCGSGVPIARALAARFRVTGVDLSAEQIRLARRNVPAGEFLEADIMALALPPASFGAAVAFYTVFHLPREEHAELLRRIHTWLKPGGYLLATLTARAEAPYTEGDFFGVTMYWSNYGLEEYRPILATTGFQLLETTTIGNGYAPDEQATAEQHPLILAQVV